MAFRKQDLFQVHENFDSYPLVWEDPVIHVEKSLNGSALHCASSVLMKSCEEISKEQLDPNLVTLESMLEAGVTLDPTVVMHFMDVTDKAELAQRSQELSMNLYEYLVDQGLIENEN